jgi:hypothetical protein
MASKYNITFEQIHLQSKLSTQKLVGSGAVSTAYLPVQKWKPDWECRQAKFSFVEEFLGERAPN